MTTYSVALAGTTSRTIMCAEALSKDERFSIPWVLTPEPRAVGRKQVLEKNPVHAWALQQNKQVVTLSTKIDALVRQDIESRERPDFLLVVDFGYLVPSWLLEWPTVRAVNIHPSDLPRWRGSSPGQFVLLYGEPKSAVCLMEMSRGMDEGALIHAERFSVLPSWTQQEYYAESFAKIAPQLPGLLSQVASGELQAVPQPTDSPTPTASRLSKADSFVPWECVAAAMRGEDAALPPGLLSVARAAHPSLAALLASAARAFSPWPLLWTEVETTSGTKRMQMLSCHRENTHLVLDSVKIEGKTSAPWETAKTTLRPE